ncbi:MAG: hypothetical protein CMJ81_14635 [Planctomycetaceae bacterium]|nr:hypothetical protein [Planctomycetaceae bacterium]MBP60885.1 hypothetical protein [Planctomycetaceae bacterium]
MTGYTKRNSQVRVCQVVFSVALCIAVLLVTSPCRSDDSADHQRIHPYPANPFYWQYKGEPVLLVGGSVDDNLFQLFNLEQHLDEIQAAGGNYIRNTMSDRRDQGFEVYPFKKLASGKYNLDHWNAEYWTRFENMLRCTYQSNIVVQIEVWDRFDYSGDHWPPHPYNPSNNVNYNENQTSLATRYPDHPGQNQQPFFFTTPRQQNNQTLLRYQQRFVDKMLSLSLKYGHVLYCIDNETSGEEDWATYWEKYIRRRAKEVGMSVCITEMWDNWNLRARRHRRTLDHPERYDFVDVSQNNHQQGQTHWDNFQWVRSYLKKSPRPINTVKTYGADGNKFGHSNQDGVERFWRHLLGGAAAVRFHRPESGLGLSNVAVASLQAARKLETLIKLWDVEPANYLLSGRETNEAFLAAAPGKAYIVYFTSGGSVNLDLKQATGTFKLHWISVDTGQWADKANISGGNEVPVSPPDNGNWVAAIVK